MAAHNNAMMQLLEKIEGFFPNETADMVTLQDLKNPTSNVVLKFLGRALYEFNIEFDTLKMCHYSQSLCSNYPENYAEIIPYINVYEIYSRIFQLADINVELSMRDILQPKPNQNVKVMNAVMDFLIYGDQKISELEPIFEEIRQEKQRVANMEQTKHLLRERINDLMNENCALDRKKKELREGQEDLVKSLKAQGEKKEEMEKVKNEEVAKLKESETKLAKATVKMQELQEEREKLNTLIVDSPLKIKSDIENQRRKRVECSKRLEDLRDNIAQLKAQNNHVVSVLEMLEQWTKKMERAQGLTKIIGELEAKLKEANSNLNAIEKSYKELDKRHVINVKKIEMAETKEKEMSTEYETKLRSLKLLVKEKTECLESQTINTEESSKAYSSVLEDLESTTEDLKRSKALFNEVMKILHDKCEEIIEKDTKFQFKFTKESEDRIAELKKILQKKLSASHKKNFVEDL